jgi:hypothetical protein
MGRLPETCVDLVRTSFMPGPQMALTNGNRLYFSFAIVLVVRRNHLRSSRPTCIWGILKVAEGYDSMRRYGECCHWVCHPGTHLKAPNYRMRILTIGCRVVSDVWTPLSRQVFYARFTVSRWLSIRFNLFSCAIVSSAALVCLLSPSISASLAGFALAFASTITGNLVDMVSTSRTRTPSSSHSALRFAALLV